jgi:DNA polymerase-3 subunit epsilon
VVTVQDGAVIDEWSSLVRLRWPWQRVGARSVHGIDRRTLRAAPVRAHVMRELADRLDGSVFTAHNAAFDWSFIQRAARRDGVALPPVRRLCTLRLLRRLDPDRTASHRLDDLCLRYDVTNVRPHDALHDARATATVLHHLLAANRVAEQGDLDDLYERR